MKTIKFSFKSNPTQQFLATTSATTSEVLYCQIVFGIYKSMEVSISKFLLRGRVAANKTLTYFYHGSLVAAAAEIFKFYNL